MNGSCFSYGVPVKFYGTESTKKAIPFIQPFLCLFCHYLNIIIKWHFRDFVKTGTVHFCSHSGPVNGITLERTRE